jgi:hypothetical protein
LTIRWEQTVHGEELPVINLVNHPNHLECNIEAIKSPRPIEYFNFKVGSFMLISFI